MAEETDLGKCNFRNFRSCVTLILTLDRVDVTQVRGRAGRWSDATSNSRCMGALHSLLSTKETLGNCYTVLKTNENNVRNVLIHLCGSVVSDQGVGFATRWFQV